MNQKLNRIRQILVAFVLTAAMTGISSCEKYSFTARPVDPKATWYFKADIQPIFNSNCITCHGGSQSPDLRDGKSYTALKNSGYLKTPGETSTLYSKMISTSHSVKSTSNDKLKVLYWINQGALNN